MRELLAYFMAVIDSSIIVLMAAAFVWGLFSVCFSSAQLKHYCIVLDHMNGSPNIFGRRGLILSVLLSINVLIITLLVGFATIIAGQMIGSIGFSPKYSTSLILLIFGAYLIGAVPVPSANITPDNTPKSKGYISAFIDGFVYVAKCLPCMFLFFSPLLCMIVIGESSHISRFVLILLSYAAGQLIILALIGIFSHPIRLFLEQTSNSGIIELAKKTIGGILVLFGFSSVL